MVALVWVLIADVVWCCVVLCCRFFSSGTLVSCNGLFVIPVDFFEPNYCTFWGIITIISGRCFKFKSFNDSQAQFIFS